MKSRTILVALLATLIPFMSGACRRVEQAAGPASEAAELEPQSHTVFGERLLLFLEFPHLVKGQEARFLAHLSVLADGEPVRAGRVTLHIGPTALSAETPKREGLFIPTGSAPTAGTFPSRLVVESPQASETLDLGEITVHPDAAAARKASEAEAGEPLAGSVPFLMEQQWKVKLLLARAGPATLARRLILPAQSRIPEGHRSVVSSPIAGRLVAPESARFPRSGERVEAGQILGHVDPSLAPGDVAQIQALQLELNLKVLDVVRVNGEAEARLRFAEREHERIAKLREPGLSTQQDLDQAEQNLAVARNEEAAARAARQALDEVVKSRPAQEGPRLGRMNLTAPISGTVVASQRVQGESVAAGDELFQVIDTTQMTVEGQLSEFDLEHLQAGTRAAVTFPGLPGKRFDLGATPWVAPTVDDASRTLALRYPLPNPEQSVKAGMMAELSLVTGEFEAPVVIPASAIVPDQGLPTAYVMLEGELFQRRDLELGLRDGERVEVKKGITAGEWVATRGSHVIRLASLSPASFGPGHAH